MKMSLYISATKIDKKKKTTKKKVIKNESLID